MNDTLFGFSFTISPVVTSGIILFAAVWLVLSILGDVWSFFEKKEPPAHHELGAVVAAQTLVASMIAENEFRAFIGDRKSVV